MLQMPIKIVGFVERVLITLPQAQRTSASTYFGCVFSFIKRAVNLAPKRRLTSANFQGFFPAVARTVSRRGKRRRWFAVFPSSRRAELYEALSGWEKRSGAPRARPS